MSSSGAPPNNTNDDPNNNTNRTRRSNRRRTNIAAFEPTAARNNNNNNNNSAHSTRTALMFMLLLLLMDGEPNNNHHHRNTNSNNKDHLKARSGNTNHLRGSSSNNQNNNPNNNENNNPNGDAFEKDNWRRRYRALNQYFGAALGKTIQIQTQTKSLNTTHDDNHGNEQASSSGGGLLLDDNDNNNAYTSTTNNVTGFYKGSWSMGNIAQPAANLDDNDNSSSLKNNNNNNNSGMTMASPGSPVSSVLIPKSYHVAAEFGTSFISDALVFVPSAVAMTQKTVGDENNVNQLYNKQEESQAGMNRNNVNHHPSDTFTDTSMQTKSLDPTTTELQTSAPSAKLALQLDTIRHDPFDELKEVDVVSGMIKLYSFCSTNNSKSKDDEEVQQKCNRARGQRDITVPVRGVYMKESRRLSLVGNAPPLHGLIWVQNRHHRQPQPRHREQQAVQEQVARDNMDQNNQYVENLFMAFVAQNMILNRDHPYEYVEGGGGEVLVQAKKGNENEGRRRLRASSSLENASNATQVQANVNDNEIEVQRKVVNDLDDSTTLKNTNQRNRSEKGKSFQEIYEVIGYQGIEAGEAETLKNGNVNANKDQMSSIIAKDSNKRKTNAAQDEEPIAMSNMMIHGDAINARPIIDLDEMTATAGVYNLDNVNNDLLLTLPSLSDSTRMVGYDTACHFVLDLYETSTSTNTGDEDNNNNGKKNTIDKNKNSISNSHGLSSKLKYGKNLSGRLYSPNCNLAATVQLDEIRTNWTEASAKAINYSFYMMLVCMAQIVFLLRQLIHTQSSSAASKVSLLCIGWQTLLDAYLCVMHVVAALVMDRVFTAFASVAFFKLLIFCVIEMKYMAMIMQARDNQTNNTTPTRESLRQLESKLHMRFYISFFCSLIVLWVLVQDYLFSAMMLLYSFWVPQIVYNVYTEAKRPLHTNYIYTMSLTRLVIPLYYFAVPNNFLKEVVPDFASDLFMCEMLFLWVGLQTGVLVAQGKYGARFMIPKRFLPPKFEYTRPLPQIVLENGTRRTSSSSPDNNVSHHTTDGTDLESQLSLSNVQQSSGPRHRTNNNHNTSNHNNSHHTHGRSRTNNNNNNVSFDCVICCGDITPAEISRQEYMLAPCNHVFHGSCLRSWMDVKMECPVCRTELPAV